MSMTKALVGTRDWLIGESSFTWGTGSLLALTKDQCFLAHMTIPQKITGQFAITLDDAGVEATVPNNFYRKEIYSISVGLWRKVGRVPGDRTAQQLIIDQSIYSPLAVTLARMENDIITALHCNQAVPTWINSASKFNLPDSTNEIEPFLQWWVYRGRSENETHIIDESGQKVYGRVLKFEGMLMIKEHMQAERQAALA